MKISEKIIEITRGLLKIFVGFMFYMVMAFITGLIKVALKRR
jgi:hypothetical protein